MPWYKVVGNKYSDDSSTCNGAIYANSALEKKNWLPVNDLNWIQKGKLNSSTLSRSDLENSRIRFDMSAWDMGSMLIINLEWGDNDQLDTCNNHKGIVVC